MRGADVRTAAAKRMCSGANLSRGLACVLVRCSLYPWAARSACRVDIEGGAVLGSLFWLTHRRATREKRPWAAA